MNPTQEQIRRLALELLTDDHGISNDSWIVLKALLVQFGGCKDILEDVEQHSVNERWFLNEAWGNG